MAVSLWGEDSQLRMCIEEISELTKEICKYMRLLKDGDSCNALINLQRAKENLRQEIADVLNTVQQLEFIFGKDEMEKIRDQKIERELKRLKEQKNE